MKETALFDSWGSQCATSVRLEDVAELARAICTDAKVSVHYEDYDEYGCEHYVLIDGACGYLQIQKNYGGMFFPADYLDCSVGTKHGEDKSSEVCYEYRRGSVVTSHHRYEYRLKKDVEAVSIGRDYEASLRGWIGAHKKYLEASPELFQRVDMITYPDLRGSRKWGNEIASYDLFVVDDEDFYTSEQLRHDVRRRLLPVRVTQNGNWDKYL